ncbi:MAG: hypothetical protein RLO50_02965 [Azospirillaceae bacterium]
MTDAQPLVKVVKVNIAGVLHVAAIRSCIANRRCHRRLPAGVDGGA